jgi:hypothetical protein
MGRKTTRTVVAMFAAALLAVASLGSVAPASVELAAPEASHVHDHDHLAIDHEEWMQDCLELVPESVGFSGVTDDGQRITLTILVLMDFEEGVEIARLQRDEDRQEEAEAALAALVEKVDELLDPAHCTVMFNFLDFLTFQFSTVSGAVVRGHAVDYADDRGF